MKCNIMTIGRKVKEVPCYKTEYKNVIIAKVDEHHYSITHWQTGVALSYNRYTNKRDAISDLPEVIEKIRSLNINLKQFCKEKQIKQINFRV